MNPNMPFMFVKKLNEACGLEDDNLIYALVPSIDDKPAHMKGVYAHALDNIPLIVDSAVEIFGGKKTNAAKSSHAYLRLKEEKNNFFETLSTLKQLLDVKESKISDDEQKAAFAALLSIYLESFTRPVQFYLPHSSVCSGHWEFWDKINYLEFIESINNRDAIKTVADQISKSDVWKIKFGPEDFPEIVKRRLAKEKKFDKKLDPNAMMKAIIIRMGELAEPDVNYEIVDYSIRNLFTYLKVEKYLRVDREIMLLRKFEEEMKKILAKI